MIAFVKPIEYVYIILLKTDIYHIHMLTNDIGVNM